MGVLNFSLCTFTNVNGAFDLGHGDCFVVNSVEPGKAVYTVNCFYTSRPSSAGIVVGADRSAAEGYLTALAASLGLTTLQQSTDSSGRTVYAPAPGSLPGTLANPFTSLSISDLYCTGIESQDSGDVSFGFTVTFEKPVDYTLSASATPVTFTPNGLPAVEIGNTVGTISVEKSVSGLSFSVSSSYNGADRAAVENYMVALLSDLDPKPLYPVTVLEDEYLLPRVGAAVGTLSNPLGLTSDTDQLFCTEVTFSDSGSNTVGISATFVQPALAAISPPPGLETRIPRTSGHRNTLIAELPLGNLKGSVSITPTSAFLNIEVTCYYFRDPARLSGTTFPAEVEDYAAYLATQLWFGPTVQVEFPRAANLFRGAVKKYKVEPAETDVSLLFNGRTYTKVYVQSVSARQIAACLAEVSLSFIKVREDYSA